MSTRKISRRAILSWKRSKFWKRSGRVAVASSTKRGTDLLGSSWYLRFALVASCWLLVDGEYIFICSSFLRYPIAQMCLWTQSIQYVSINWQALKKISIFDRAKRQQLMMELETLYRVCCAAHQLHASAYERTPFPLPNFARMLKLITIINELIFRSKADCPYLVSFYGAFYSDGTRCFIPLNQNKRRDFTPVRACTKQGRYP